MDLFRIGRAEGPQRLGVARKAADEYEQVRATLPNSDGLQLQIWEMDTGRANLIDLRIRHFWMADLAIDFISQHNREGETWYHRGPDEVEQLVRETSAILIPESLEAAILGRVPHRRAYGDFIKSIRVQVFGTTQQLFGEIAGKSEAVVSRWEAGEALPGLSELLRIRAAAVALDLPLVDAHFINPPPEAF